MSPLVQNVLLHCTETNVHKRNLIYSWLENTHQPLNRAFRLWGALDLTWRTTTLRCSSQELFPCGFSLCEVKSSHCAWPTSSSLDSWPITVTISRHLPIKVAHFLSFSPCDSSSGRAMTAPTPSNWLFSCQLPGMVDFSIWHNSMWLLVLHLWSVLRPTTSL